jgi:hypothetical protein
MFNTGTDKFASTMDVDLSPAAAVTADGNSASVKIGDRGTVRLTLAVSGVDGTNPTMDVTIQTSADDGDADPWRTLGTFAQVTADGEARKSFGGADKYIRANFNIGGTDDPTFTISLTGEAL